MIGTREAATRAYYEAIEATNRANRYVEDQRANVKALEQQLANAQAELAELESDAADALLAENAANSYAQEVRS